MCRGAHYRVALHYLSAIKPRLVNVLDELTSVANASLAFDDEFPGTYRVKVGLRGSLDTIR